MKALAFLLLILAGNAQAKSCDQFYAFGAPTNAKTKLCNISYAVHYNKSCKAPDLVMEYIKPENIGGVEPRIRFKTDRRVVEGAIPGDYYKSGYDKGHLAAAANFNQNSASIAQSFYMTNVVPQTTRLNRGPWKSLEIKVRALAVKNSGLYVYTGALFSKNKIGSGVCVPSHTYKLIIEEKTLQSIAYMLPNTVDVQPFSNYVMNIGDLEKITGIDYVPKMSPDTADWFKKTVGAGLLSSLTTRATK